MTTDFSGFNLPAPVMQSLARMNFTTPTPIQAQAIPLALQGHDILGSAQTGTGKTGAFGIPLIVKLIQNPMDTALIMTPTRELAAQVLATLEQLNPSPTIKTALLIGGEPMPKQFRQLQNRPRLIVGTPGRINDHLERGTLMLAQARFLVLDETDRMLDMGFGVQLDRIMRFMPKKRQTMMFSATMPQNIMQLSAKYLHQPQRITIGSTTKPAAKITQENVNTTDADKYNQLTYELSKREGSVIIFVKTKFGADRMATRLCRSNFEAEAIHGDLKQSRRDRVIQEFRDKKYRILVATDVAARGLDIPHIEHVINYDLPQAPEDYIHRIGRTARAGAEGSAVNLLTVGDADKWRAIQKLLNPGVKIEGGPSSAAPGKKGKKPFRHFGNKNRDKKPSFGKKPEGEKRFGDRKRSFGGKPSFDKKPGGSGPKRRFDTNRRSQNNAA